MIKKILEKYFTAYLFDEAMSSKAKFVITQRDFDKLEKELQEYMAKETIMLMPTVVKTRKELEKIYPKSDKNKETCNHAWETLENGGGNMGTNYFVRCRKCNKEKHEKSWIEGYKEWKENQNYGFEE